MGEVNIIGLDLAKVVFQAHGSAADGSVVLRRKLSRARQLKLVAAQPFCVVAIGSLCQLASLGRRPRPRGAADTSRLCDAVREAPEERHGGCRGGVASDDAVYCREDRGM
jgi:transposase